MQPSCVNRYPSLLGNFKYLPPFEITTLFSLLVQELEDEQADALLLGDADLAPAQSQAWTQLFQEVRVDRLEADQFVPLPFYQPHLAFLGSNTRG